MRPVVDLPSFCYCRFTHPEDRALLDPDVDAVGSICAQPDRLVCLLFNLFHQLRELAA
jgi:hypothetical protein